MKRTLYTLAVFIAVSVAIALAQATHITTSGTLPTHCTVGDIYYKTGTSAGLYNCTATDTWTAVGGGGGSAWLTVSAKSSNFSAVCGNAYAVTTSTSTITATLPSASGSAACEIVVKKVDNGSGTVSIARAGSDLIDGLTSQTVTAQYAVYSLLSDGSSNWWIR